MELVVASAELKGGNVLSFNLFPSYPFPLGFVITFHVEGEVRGNIAYRVRKREAVIHQTEATPFHVPAVEGQKTFSLAGSIEVVFPSQGSYLLDIVFDDGLLHSLPFSVFDNSQRTDLEKEIIYYLERKRGAKSVEDITRGVYNPRILDRANIGEAKGKVYFALLRMKEVVNTNPTDQGSLQEKMNASRWQLKPGAGPAGKRK
jgi:hypothetical protein